MTKYQSVAGAQVRHHNEPPQALSGVGNGEGLSLSSTDIQFGT